MSLAMNARRRTSPQPFLAKSHVALNGGHLVPPVASPCQIRSAQSSVSTLAPSPRQVPGAAAAPCIAPRSLPPSATRGPPPRRRCSGEHHQDAAAMASALRPPPPTSSTGSTGRAKSRSR
ncbi:uncharacterized protein [Triticum aestivum]|uniref:uncharacterized protein n=1 Tax=Triticum aestivum TaxID=4565 RepID=UPI001D0037E3|nr:uncharacterized protein LOC123141440 [Triticum aestivum]